MSMSPEEQLLREQAATSERVWAAIEAESVAAGLYRACPTLVVAVGHWKAQVEKSSALLALALLESRIIANYGGGSSDDKGDPGG